MDVTSATNQANTAGNASNSLSKLADDFNNFLTILTTQLQHQDPLDPLDSNEFTSQLVQFTGVEQQVLQNQNLESLIALQEQSQTVGTVSYIGKVVEAAGNTNMLTDGAATFSYVLPGTAAAAVMQIFDSSGDIVFQQPVSTEAGIHDVVWDGTTSGGGTAKDGIYSFRVAAIDEEDQSIEVVHRIIGRVTGVSFEADNTILGIGEVGVPLDAITGVQDAPEDAEQSEQG